MAQDVPSLGLWTVQITKSKHKYIYLLDDEHVVRWLNQKNKYLGSGQPSKIRVVS